MEKTRVPIRLNGEDKGNDVVLEEVSWEHYATIQSSKTSDR
jgi:hypothetical protein